MMVYMAIINDLKAGNDLDRDDLRGETSQTARSIADYMDQRGIDSFNITDYTCQELDGMGVPQNIYRNLANRHNLAEERPDTIRDFFRRNYGRVRDNFRRHWKEYIGTGMALGLAAGLYLGVFKGPGREEKRGEPPQRIEKAVSCKKVEVGEDVKIPYDNWVRIDDFVDESGHVIAPPYEWRPGIGLYLSDVEDFPEGGFFPDKAKVEDGAYPGEVFERFIVRFEYRPDGPILDNLEDITNYKMMIEKDLVRKYGTESYPVAKRLDNGCLVWELDPRTVKIREIGDK